VETSIAKPVAQRKSYRIDPWFEVLQFLVAKRKAGLLVFATEQSRDTWQREHRGYLLEHFCFWLEAFQTWRFERTFLALVVINEPNDMRRIYGKTFDKVWFVDDIELRMKQTLIALTGRFAEPETKRLTAGERAR
jgi:hypothetical protein